MDQQSRQLANGYLALCVLGGLLPLRHITMFLIEHGFDTGEFFRQVYATRIGAFFTADVAATLVTLIVFIMAESKRTKLRRYWIAFLGLIIGVSLALPLFLYLRERQRMVDSVH